MQDATGTQDIVIIGGGVMGLFAALSLAEHDAGRITVIEKRTIGAGSSGKSGAILRQHYSHETTIRMARECLLFYRDFQDKTGHDIGFRSAPMIFICPIEDQPVLERNVALQQSLGVHVDLLDASQLRDVEPRATIPDNIVAAFEHDSGYVEPMKTLAAIAALCSDRGVNILQGRRVVDILLDGHQQATGVQLDDGAELAADVIINAGGPWAKLLCDRLNIDLPLQAIRPEQAYFMPPAEFGSEKYIFGDLITGLYWKPETAGWTRIGKMAYDGDEVIDNPDEYDEGVSHAFIDYCRRQMTERFADYQNAICWGGCGALYTVTPDSHALIGPLPGIENVYITSGFSGHGFKLGPAVGRGLAGMITGSDIGSFNPELFAPDRFLRKAAVTSAYKYGILG